MKALRNKVILSAVVLAFALIATIGSTYAWFTVSQNVAVESLTLNVSASDSLLIKVADQVYTEAQLRDVSNYKTTLTNADIITGYYANLSTWKLQPVSVLNAAYDDIDAKNLTYLSSLTNYTRPLASSPASNATDGYFIEINFWLYSQADSAKDIVLTTLGVTAADQDGTKEDVVNAVRLAVWGDDSTYNLADGAADEAFIYGLTSDYGFAFVNNGLPGFYTGTPDTTNFNTLDEKGITTSGALTLASTTSTMATANSDVIFNLEANTPTLFTVRIYVEGWEEYATNDIVAGIFAINWGFGFAA